MEDETDTTRDKIAEKIYGEFRGTFDSNSMGRQTALAQADDILTIKVNGITIGQLIEQQLRGRSTARPPVTREPS